MNYRIDLKTILLQGLCMLFASFNPIQCDKAAQMCTVCRVVVSEANWAIGQVDPKKKVTGGSFRVDPKGNQPYKKAKKYARSETHLEELFDKICEKFNYYGEITKEDGSKHIVRTEDFDHTILDITDKDKLDRDVARSLIYRCGDFLEDHIDEVISLLQKDDIPNYEKAICAEETNVCSLETLSVPMMVIPPAVEDPLRGKPVMVPYQKVMRNGVVLSDGPTKNERFDIKEKPDD